MLSYSQKQRQEELKRHEVERKRVSVCNVSFLVLKLLEFETLISGGGYGLLELQLLDVGSQINSLNESNQASPMLIAWTTL